MTASNELPEWPKKPRNAVASMSLEQVYQAWLDYQEARADTAIALLRACEDFLTDWQMEGFVAPGAELDRLCSALLARIGEVEE